MTRTVVEPETLRLLYPKATPVHPEKLRLIVQVRSYDLSRAILSVARFPNVPSLVVHIDLDDEPKPQLEIVEVDVSHVLQNMTLDIVDCGLAVSIVGVYDGSKVTAFECTSVDGQLLLDGRIELLGKLATLRDL